MRAYLLPTTSKVNIDGNSDNRRESKYPKLTYRERDARMDTASKGKARRAVGHGIGYGR